MKPPSPTTTAAPSVIVFTSLFISALPSP
jgi:hypothetical protein